MLQCFLKLNYLPDKIPCLEFKTFLNGSSITKPPNHFKRCAADKILTVTGNRNGHRKLGRVGNEIVRSPALRTRLKRSSRFNGFNKSRNRRIYSRWTVARMFSRTFAFAANERSRDLILFYHYFCCRY